MCKKYLLFPLLLLLLSVNAHSKPQQFKDWFVDNTGDRYYYAATYNDSEHLLGQYCYLKTEKCLYLVGIKITCEEESKIPALINSDKGAVQVSLVCGEKFDNQNVLVITPFDEIDNVVRRANHIRIAVPLEDDQFQVSRFSLSGSTYAIDTMISYAQQAIERKPKKTPHNDVEYL